MTSFEFLEPRSLREASSMLGADDALPVSGGTAVMLMLKMGVLRPARVVSLRSIEKRYSEISVGADGALRIGAMATLSALERSSAVRSHSPVVTRALKTLSNVRVRNVATLGGHLAHADPHMDLPPVLIALDASITTVSGSGERTLPLGELYAGYLENTLGRGELIAEVTVPRRDSRRAVYMKCTVRSADDWPALGVAVALDTADGMVRDARIVLSAVTDTPTRLAAVEGVLRSARVDDAVLRRAGEAAADEIASISDAHGSAAYKKELVRVYVARAIRAALDNK